ncbi:hypothetical protein AcW1_008642 [Taiwanofungus camphoratus]|nr:hypothetical protein AcW1_008642 [Antrodia cinnamomea]
MPVYTYSQSTQTDKYAACEWLCKGDIRGRQRKIHSTQYIHYRLAVSTVGYALQTFRGTEELLHCTHDAFHAMLEARDKNNRIHRDISPGDVILVKEPSSRIRKGYLIDWELSCYVDEHGQAHEYDRVVSDGALSAEGYVSASFTGYLAIYVDQATIG